MKYKVLKNILLICIPVLIIIFVVSSVAEIIPKQKEDVLRKPIAISEGSVTVLLNNSKNIIPLKNLELRSIVSIGIGNFYNSVFDSILNKYTKVVPFSIPGSASIIEMESVTARLNFFNTVILQVNEADFLNLPLQNFITELNKTKQLILVAHGNPVSLQFLDKVDCPIIWNEQNSFSSSVFIAQSIFGGVPLNAKLHQAISPKYVEGSGYTTSPTRLSYVNSAELGIDSRYLEIPIDKIVAEAIAQKATPGAVVMVVKDGKVILNKGYGTHTYQNIVHTRADDIFDLASVTKIGATTIAAMRLCEQRKLNLDTTIGTYITLARNTNKNTITVKELLLHQAGLTPFIPFFENLKIGDYSRDSSFFYPTKVADNYYLRANYFDDVMWPRMLNSSLQSKGSYVYSDLSMYMMKDIIERISTVPLEKYVVKQFYAPLGMQTAGFNPRLRFEKHRIVPTENDTHFRKTLLEGYVHDQGAAMAGGVAGHAGLFSSANDMAILFQMFLNGGTYGGERYFKQETIDLFTAKYSNVSRRGLGFDRWDPDRSNRYPSDLASAKSYGHTGYTGTCVWVDPEYNLIYIFLSNRVHPSVTNKLSSLRIRPRIHDVIYEAIKKAEN